MDLGQDSEPSAQENSLRAERPIEVVRLLSLIRLMKSLLLQSSRHTWQEASQLTTASVLAFLGLGIDFDT